MCAAGHTSVSSSVFIANTLSCEHQCAGYLEGGVRSVKEEEGEAKKSNGCLKINEVRGIFYSEIFEHTPPSFSFLPSSLLLHPPQYLTELLLVIIDSSVSTESAFPPSLSQ